MSVFELLKEKIKNAGKKYRLVFPEGEDLRILEAASRLAQDRLMQPILLGNPDQIAYLIKEKQLALTDSMIVDPSSYQSLGEMAQAFIRARGKDIPADEVGQTLQDPNYFGTMMVKMGLADGMVSGAAHSTAATVRPALQLIHAASGMKRVSGGFIMERGDERYVFADCAINLDPDSATLAEIAYQSVQIARMIDIEPRVAFLSFSTKGSAQGNMVDKVIEAAKLFKKAHPEIKADGELQFDAAFVPGVAASKAPDSEVAGRANVFVFPELQSGNIAYKITQRLGNFTAIGPILQGLARPVNDLSRGASSMDIYNMAILTAAQALTEEAQ